MSPRVPRGFPLGYSGGTLGGGTYVAYLCSTFLDYGLDLDQVSGHMVDDIQQRSTNSFFASARAHHRVIVTV